MGSRAFESQTEILAVACVVIAAMHALAAVLVLLRRTRPDLSIATPVAVMLALKVCAVLVVALLPNAPELRGPDDQTFLKEAEGLAQSSLLSRDSFDALTSTAHIWFFSLQLHLELPEAALRITQVAVATIGLVLLVATVYDLVGGRPARLVAWLLALEPTSAFFSGLLHKESLMLLATGMVALGGVRLWRGDPRGLAIALPGCAVAVCTRPYAGWFLVGGLAVMMLHAGLRREGDGYRGRVILAAATFVGVLIAIPYLVTVSSNERLETLQAAQNANVATPANLPLEPVDFSSRSSVIQNLPRRMGDVLLRPYPWQIQNMSQQLGLLGTLAALIAFGWLVRLLVQRRGQLLSRAAPLVYPAIFLLIAYSLSAGNAGTSFRYRTHLVALGICMIGALAPKVGRRLADRGSRSLLQL